MRRKDREMPEAFALEVADRCEWATLAMVDPEGLPYCVPVSIVREGAVLYFHCANAGLKIDCLAHQPQVCLSCVGRTRLLPEEYSTEFESAVIRGRAAAVTEDEEKIHALRLICQRYAASNMEAFDSAIAKSLFRTHIYRIAIESATGKQKLQK